VSEQLLQQASQVRRLADYLGTEGQLLDPHVWGQRHAEYERAADALEAQMCAERPLSERKTCWKCGRATFPNPRGRRDCLFCDQPAEEVPHPADCEELARIDALLASRPAPLELVREVMGEQL